MLVGRGPERELLETLIDRARDGSAGVLVIHGEPGVGKSALLDEAVGNADSAVVLRTQGLEVESPFPFAALQRLLRPVMRMRGELPAPQARALGVAFGEEEGPSIDPFLVGVAALGMLTMAAEEALVVCSIDDAHWLDAASAAALLFCARRIGADRVAMVFTVRDGVRGNFDPEGLPAVQLHGLGSAEARELLDRVLGAEVSDDVVDRIVVDTGGNPLALLELPGELTRAQLAGSELLPSPLHLTTRVERAFLDRSQRLAPSVQAVLLLCATDDTGEREVLHRAAAKVGATESDLEVALQSGLVVGTPSSITVRHPLVRSAVYQAATIEQRRAAHSALSDAFAGRGNRDLEIWHRAQAADDGGSEVVSALGEAGARAERRGAFESALAAYERAAGLCDDSARRSELSLSAAKSAWACGRTTRATALLAAAREGAEDPRLMCDIDRLRGHIEVNLGSAIAAHRIFVTAAEEVLPFDGDRALEIAVAAAVMRTFGADSRTPLTHGRALSTPVAGDPVRTECLRHLLGSMTAAIEGEWGSAAATLDRAFECGERVDDRDILWNLGNAAFQLGDDEAQQRFYGRALARAREAGQVTAVMYCLQRLCFGHYVAGDLVALRASAEEAISLALNVSQPTLAATPAAWLAVVAALQGNDEYDDRIARVDEYVGSRSLGILADPVHDLTRWANGLRSAHDGDPHGALHHFAQFRLPVLARMAAAERIAAAARAGDMTTAREWTEELAAFANATGRPWALATVSFGRALTSRASDADTHFQESIEHHGRAHRPLDAALAHLAYGEHLRRSQRRVEAREHLRRASATFQDLRAEPLAARANRELRASGETARKRDPSTLLALTPTELQIAMLVSSGLSNKEVAAQCWVSPRTVAFHLRNVFAKAGVTSRGELAQLDLT